MSLLPLPSKELQSAFRTFEFRDEHLAQLNYYRVVIKAMYLLLVEGIKGADIFLALELFHVVNLSTRDLV